MVVRRGQGDLAMSAEEELRSMEDFKRRQRYFEVKCGCTSRKFGDSIGKLRVFTNGKFMISCKCRKDCKKAKKLTPYEFVKHSKRPGTKSWTKHIWVTINDLKVPLGSTVLLQYYKKSTNERNGARKRIFHHDEFIRCSKCRKERRFRLRSQEECRMYHDVVAKKKWKCADRPYDKITCNDEEERASRKSCRGCPRFRTCNGCTSCVCFGCFKCRFKDCNCRICVDFMQHGQL